MLLLDGFAGCLCLVAFWLVVVFIVLMVYAADGLLYLFGVFLFDVVCFAIRLLIVLV